MSLRLFNLFGAGRPVTRSTGMVLATASRSVERHQTALRGRAPSPSGEAAVAHEARRPRNLSVPARRSLKTHGSIPRGGDGPGGRSGGGIETPGRRWFPPKTASAQLDIDSPAGPHRAPAPHPGGA